MESHNSGNSKKVLFIDFDGTLTDLEGHKLVQENKFYDSLFEQPEYGWGNYTPYQAGVIKDNALEIIKEEFSGETYRDEKRVTESGVTFLNVVPNQENVYAFIVTNNRKGYVKPMLELEGISLDKIGILSLVDGFCGYTSDPRFEAKLKEKIKNDFNDDDAKKRGVEALLDALIEIANEDKTEAELSNAQFYLFDDSKRNVISMASALSLEKYDDYNFCERYKSYQRDPGCFKWDDYQLDICPELKVEVEEIEQIESPAENNVSVTNFSIYSRPNTPPSSPVYSDAENAENAAVYSDEENNTSLRYSQ
jgi:hypothetical protein